MSGWSSNASSSEFTIFSTDFLSKLLSLGTSIGMCLLSCKIHGTFCHVTLGSLKLPKCSNTSAPSLPRLHSFLSKFPTERTLRGASATNAEIQHSFKKVLDGSLVATVVKNSRRQTREVGKITLPDAVENPGPEFGFKLMDFTLRYRSQTVRSQQRRWLLTESMSHQSATRWLPETCCKHLVSVDSIIGHGKRHEKQDCLSSKSWKTLSQENFDQHMGEKGCNNNAQRCILTKCQSHTKRSCSASANGQGTSQSSKPSVGTTGQCKTSWLMVRRTGSIPINFKWILAFLGLLHRFIDLAFSGTFLSLTAACPFHHC